MTVADQVRDPPGDRARLAGAGACEHTHRAARGEHRRLLFGVQ